ncbi:hypothetical protein LQV63_30125 [Paenibacillus profundus]|uniref:Major facilitator superfamily (MFS) profile domain-containing protein n=1 Tax=Paenibacillus profundus TaxID=1173085 RepID=A0ABS8YSY5_9BACL|nr:hypothetical protein [Paenibacillus profundus]
MEKVDYGFALLLTGRLVQAAGAGIVIEHVSWRWLFIGMIPLLVIVILLSIRYLTNVSETSKPKADILGIVYSTSGSEASFSVLATPAAVDGGMPSSCLV